MTLPPGPKRNYNLAIIGVEDINLLLPNPRLYVNPRLAVTGEFGINLPKTKIAQYPTLTWKYNCTITADLNSVLSLSVTHSSRWPRGKSILVGYFHLTIRGLLDRCKNNELEPIAFELGSSSTSSLNPHRRGTSLTLCNDYEQDTTSLIVDLQELPA